MSDPTPAAPRAHQNAPSRLSPLSNTVSDNDIAVRIAAAPDQAEGPRFTQADVDTLDQAAEELQGYTTEIAIRALRERIAALLPPRSADPLKSPPGY